LKDSFQWGAEAESAFQSLKTNMVSVPLLASLCFYKPFQLETDTSVKGLGVVLMQKGQPDCIYEPQIDSHHPREVCV